VTTANLFTAEYKPEDVELPEGIIKPDKASITETKWLTYELPVTEDLSTIRNINLRDLGEKLTTFVVTAKHWEEFLKGVYVIYGKGDSVDQYLIRRIES